MREYKFGELTFDEWQGFWKSSPTDPEVTGREYEEFARELDHALRLKYPNYPNDFYVRGDCHGDRSQDIEIVNPAVLDSDLLQDLKEYLLTHGSKMWRIRIPTYLGPKQVVVIYPSEIFLPGSSCGNFEQDLEALRTQLISADQK